MKSSVVFIPPAPAPLVAPPQSRASRRKKVVQFAPAVTRLLRLRCPAARAQAGAFRPERPCSPGRGEESSSAPSERNAKHEHDRRPHHHRMPRSRSAAKPIKFPAQPQEWKIVSLRECPTPENMQQCETP